MLHLAGGHRQQILDCVQSFIGPFTYHVAPPAPDTCRWIFSHAEFVRCLTDKNASSIIVIYGCAGSVIASFC
jgi:hypothetical protein